MKKVLTTIIIVAMVLGGITTNMTYNVRDVKAEEYYSYGSFTYEILNDNTIRISGFWPVEKPDVVYPDTLTVPSKIDGRDVTCIGQGAFRKCFNVTTITLPDSVTMIESYAFSETWALVNIRASTMKSIGSWAFSGCSGLFEFTIPEGITNIEEGVFSNCTRLEAVRIPYGATSIGNQAFDGCTNLKTVIIPSTVKSIGDKAFYNCTELTKIKISANATVGKDAFAGCDKLEIEYVTEKSTESTAEQTTKVEQITENPTRNALIGKTKVNKVTKKFASKKAKIKLKNISGAKYQVKISTAKNFKKKKTVIKQVTKATFIIKNMKIQKKKTLYVKARAYKVVNGKTYYGKWSNVKKVTIKK